MLLAVLLAGAGLWRSVWPEASLTGMAHASDGDTIRIGSHRIRILGIDAPERDQTCTGADDTAWRCGRAAGEAMARLLARGPADCRPEGRDRYGRTLARCTVAGTDLGAAMVSQGLAMASGGYVADQRAARSAKRGIWAGTFEPPARFRREQAEAGKPDSLGWLRQWLR